MKENKTNRLTKGAIFTALSFVFLFLSGFVPGVEMSMYAIASIMPALMIVETNKSGSGLFVYVATCILAFILIPNKLAIVPYIFFFGYYGIIKFYVEKLKSPVAQVATKIVVFAAVFGIALAFFKDLFFANITLPEIALPLLILAGIALFVLYDYIFTLAINYYISKVHRGRI